ncbi:MAG TPA: CPBP family intramembrane glutamic endopeptidase [Acidobacteriaceae bacterium]
MNSPEDDLNKDARRDRLEMSAAQHNLTSAMGSPIFFGAAGLRPFWGLLIYLAILAPMVWLAIAFSTPQGNPSPAEAVQPFSPFTVATREWLLFGFLFFATWIMSRIEDRSVFDNGLQQTPRRCRWLATGACWGLLFLSLLIAILWSTHHLVFTAVLLRPLPALGYGLAWIVAFVGVAFFEEFCFRGYLQFNLTRCFAGLIRWFAPNARFADAAGFWIAAVLISFGFGLIHKTNPGESPLGLLCAGSAGLVFAFSLWRTGSLWWAIGLHAAWDWVQSFLFGVADSGALSQGRLLESHPSGSALMSGGLTGPEGSVFVLLVLLLIALVVTFTLHRDPTADVPWSTGQSTNASSSTLA